MTPCSSTLVYTASLVLRHSTGRRTVLPVTVSTMHHDRRLTSTALHLLLYVRAVLDILPEVADVAADFLVGLQRERNNRYEAECEPFPATC